MSNRTLKILLLFLTIFAIQTVLLLVLLLRPQVSSAAIGVRAEGKDQATCPCGFKGDAEKETIRLFIPIPGVTDGCGYLCDINNDSKGDVVDYVVAIYKFLVGAAAIMAVIMIMVGGYQWIFAMGSSSAIESAKDTIKSALFGLLLTLFSYQVLHFINPRLTDVVLPEVQEIGRMQIGGYLCGGDDLLVDDVDFNTVLVGSFAEAIKSGKKLTDTDFYNKQFTGSFSPNFDLQPFPLISGLNPKPNTKDLLKCDNEAKSYLVPEVKGETPNRNPSGPEVKIAHFNTAKTKDENEQDVTKVVGIDCFYGLCDTSNKSLVDPGVALANTNILKDYAEKYAQNNGYAFKKNEVEIYNSVSTRVEPRGGGCYGSFCETPSSNGLAICFNRTGIGIGCWNVKQICEDTDDNLCSQTDEMFVSEIGHGKQLPFACEKSDEINDHCRLGTKFSCPFGFIPFYDYKGVSYAKDGAKIDGKTNKVGCWKWENKEGGDIKPNDCSELSDKSPGGFSLSSGDSNNRTVYPVEIGWAVNKVSSVCCIEKFTENSTVLTAGVCVADFNSAYNPQKLGGKVTEACEKLSNMAKCTVKLGSVSWEGNCQPLIGVKDGLPVDLTQPEKNNHFKNELTCVPSEYDTKVCHKGKDGIMYVSIEACLLRNIADYSAGSTWSSKCQSYLLPAGEPYGVYPCFDLVAAGLLEKEESGGTGGGAGDIKGKVDVIVGLMKGKESIIEEAAKAVDLNGKLGTQKLAFGPSENFPISTAYAAEYIDACKLVEVVMAQESGGEPDPIRAVGCNTTSCDCGLMQINVSGVTCSKKEDCISVCENKNYFDIKTNIEAGINELVEKYNDPDCGDPKDHTSCNLTNDVSEPLYTTYRGYKWHYMLARYNGTAEANRASVSCPTKCRTYPTCDTLPPAKLGDPKGGCFIGKEKEATPTQVECPYKDDCSLEDGEFRTITYKYVLEIEDGYKYIKDQTGDGVASCP